MRRAGRRDDPSLRWPAAVGFARMDRQAVLAAFDEQIRRHPAAEAPGESVERDAAVVRFLAGEGGRSAVTWCALDEATADAVIAATVKRFGRLGVSEWEWKHYSYDRPADLPRRLRAAGSPPSRPRR